MEHVGGWLVTILQFRPNQSKATFIMTSLCPILFLGRNIFFNNFSNYFKPRRGRDLMCDLNLP